MIRRLTLAMALLLGAAAPRPASSDLGNAQRAYADITTRFWSGPAATGHAANISETGAAVPGFTPFLPPAKGRFWEYAQSSNVIYGWWKITASTDALTRLQAQWAWVRAVWSLADVSACGVGTTSTAQDDAAWGAMALVQLYEATGDDLARQYAKGILDCAWARWQDGTTGGGLWYDDTDAEKSSYQAPYAMASLGYYLLTSDGTYLTRATAIDAWAATVLQRSDGLYWEGVGPTSTPLGQNRPYQIAQTNSVVLLVGNMAWAALDAQLYTLCTGNAGLCPNTPASYLTRLRSTAAGILAYETSGGGLLDDRDAYTNGWGAVYYARLAVPLLADGGATKRALQTTARTIAANRGADATYGGDWQGPLHGVWYAAGVTEEYAKVSAQGANAIIAGYAVGP